MKRLCPINRCISCIYCSSNRINQYHCILLRNQQLGNNTDVTIFPIPNFCPLPKADPVGEKDKKEYAVKVLNLITKDIENGVEVEKFDFNINYDIDSFIDPYKTHHKKHTGWKEANIYIKWLSQEEE